MDRIGAKEMMQRLDSADRGMSGSLWGEVRHSLRRVFVYGLIEAWPMLFLLGCTPACPRGVGMGLAGLGWV